MNSSKHRNRDAKLILLTGAIASGLIIVFGVFNAFSKGANDFSVFYEAWHLVLSGRGTEIYRVSPDRFLYGPGFAWILAPFAVVPKNVALAIWCVAKVFVVGFIANQFSHRLKSSCNLLSGDSVLSLGLSLWGIALVARPLLIDFSYGQVNLFLLGACVWALLGHFNPKRSLSGDISSWGLLTWMALSKLFPVPLLAIPWFVTQGIQKKKLRNERLGVLLGGVAVSLPPLFFLGCGGSWRLLIDWRDALILRGLPLESHNQSFTALLYHYLSGYPTQILSEGATPLFLGWARLSSSQIGLLALFWTTLTMGFTLGWVCSGPQPESEIRGQASPLGNESIRWSVVAIGLLIIPSHLIWKPYFVMSVPLAILFIHQVYNNNDWVSYLTAFGLFIGINLTGFDFIGHHWAAHVEASSILLILHIVLIFLTAAKRPQIGYVKKPLFE